MQNTFKNIVRVAFAFALVTGLAACSGASREELDAVQATANSALSEAKAARETASEAATAAQEAKSAADSANSCCQENTEKLNRMFERTMRK
jgi:ElaB/YqjD/DUF883 family membrane-anchored ribosome-binding protein